MTVLADRLASLMQRVDHAARRAGRDASDVTIVVITKGRTSEAITELYEAGQRDFGENRAQELATKTPLLPADIRWHFVGPLQTNKVRIVRPVASLLHSYDRIDIGRAWMKGPGNPPPVLVQVNIGDEPQKHGWPPSQVRDAFDRGSQLGLDMRGLMAIPPLGSEPEDARPYFARMRELSERVQADHPRAAELSIGMTDDFEVAIEEGATMIRPGRAIFEA